MNPLAFVERHGVVLAAGRGPIPSLAEEIACAPIRGSWWGHPKAHLIFAALGEVHDSPDVLTCRLVQGKRTFVHRRLWPALLRLQPGPFEPLDRVREEHTASGKHLTHAEAWPGWLPARVAAAARKLSEEDARAALGAAAGELSAPPASINGKKRASKSNRSR